MGRWPEWRRERVWELWVEGHSVHAISREVGMARDHVTACVAVSGGVRPAPRRRAEGCLSLGEREEISRGLARGESFRAIGRAIGRPHTTVAREVNRNGGRRRYRAQRAESATWKRARRPKPSKLAADSRLRGVVEEKLERKWSPQQISRWLWRTYEDDPAMGVSHETIYLSLFVQSRGALRRELWSSPGFVDTLICPGFGGVKVSTKPGELHRAFCFLHRPGTRSLPLRDPLCAGRRRGVGATAARRSPGGRDVLMSSGSPQKGVSTTQRSVGRRVVGYGRAE
jgi:hypothetical protein